MIQIWAWSLCIESESIWILVCSNLRIWIRDQLGRYVLGSSKLGSHGYFGIYKLELFCHFEISTRILNISILTIINLDMLIWTPLLVSNSYLNVDPTHGSMTNFDLEMVLSSKIRHGFKYIGMQTVWIRGRTMVDLDPDSFLSIRFGISIMIQHSTYMLYPDLESTWKYRSSSRSGYEMRCSVH